METRGGRCVWSACGGDRRGSWVGPVHSCEGSVSDRRRSYRPARAARRSSEATPYPDVYLHFRLIGEKAGNVGRGINIAIVNYVTGEVIATQYFDMYEGDNSGSMTKFIQDAPEKSLLFMATHDDGGSRLKQEARGAIEALGSKEIRNVKFRSSWVFLAAKGFELPAGTQREKINHSNQAKNRYSGWPAEVQIEGCVPKEPH